MAAEKMPHNQGQGEQSPAEPAPPPANPGYQEAAELLRKMAEAAAGGLSTRPPGLLPGDPPDGSAEEELNTPSDRARIWRAERRYRALIEQIPVITFVAAIDETVHELYVSPQIEAVLGFSQSEWLDNPFLWYNQLHPDDREHWQKAFALTCTTGVEFKSDYRLLARDGRVVWIHGECQLIRDEHGQPLFLQGVAYDISERKHAEAELLRMHRDLELIVQQRTMELAAANEALRAEIVEHQAARMTLAKQAAELAEAGRRKDEFLAILSHELRNPLSPLTMAAELLRNPALANADREWAQNTIDRQVKTMTRLIDDLLDVSRITRGNIQLRKVPMDLSLTIQHAIMATQTMYREQRHELIVSGASAPLWLEGDSTRLEQVVTNLLTNAAKYTPPGGRVWLSAAAEADQAVVRVRDNGIGIPPEMLDRVFELFTQIDPSVGRAFQWGMGIGLAIVRGLVELHGGTIVAHSAGRGRGAEFILRLPLLKAAPAISPAAPAKKLSAAANDRPRKVLVVEDHDDSAAGLSRLLQLWKHDVRIVHDGPTALAAAAEFCPDVVLLDIGLPGMNGYEVAQNLRQQTAFQHTLLVALTGYGRQEDRQRATAAGFNFHMTKPVDPETLRNLLADHHEESHSARG